MRNEDYPFRIELRRYANWRRSRSEETAGVASYIAKQLISSSVACDLKDESIFKFINNNPTLVIFDGFDEECQTKKTRYGT